jgi:hypothetical protein
MQTASNPGAGGNGVVLAGSIKCIYLKKTQPLLKILLFLEDKVPLVYRLNGTETFKFDFQTD